MKRGIHTTEMGMTDPWSSKADQFAAAVQQHIACDAFAVAVWQLPQPQPDELLAAHNLTGAAVERWCQQFAASDRLFRGAIEKGFATLPPEQTGDRDLMPGAHLMMHVVPESIVQQRWWCFFLARRSKAFTANEIDQASLMLRRWQANFAKADEHDMGQLLLCHDDRLLVADLRSQQDLHDRPNMLKQLLTTFHPVIQQRFPNTPVGEMRDFAVELEGKPAWVCFRMNQAVDLPRAAHWLLEIRPLEQGELPVVGELEDARIAQALAYLHENYHLSPTLAQTAKAVHMSPFHFHRLFSKQIGISPKHYLQHKQLQMAKWLLRQDRMPIGSIAVRTGFASHGHFTSTFHRIVGISPSEYREQF